MIPILDLKGQYKQIQEKLEKNVIEVLRSGSYILGPNVKAFESEIAEYCGAKHAVTCANGTDALQLALRALEIGQGDEVITVAFTFVATTEAIGVVGAKHVFVDIDPDTFLLDAALLESKITPKTKAIIPVHLYGQPAQMDVIMDIAKRYNLYVIEDCAQAIGSTFKGQKVGTFGDIGCFSFFPTKNLGAFGDAGMITTNSEYLAKRVVSLRNHGSAVRYYHDEIGLNSRMDEIQAAILRVKLPYIDEWNKKRREVAYRYNELLKDVEGVVTPKEGPNTYCVYHQYTIQVPHRDEVHKFLQENGIGAMIYYPVPLHLQKVHSYLGGKLGDLPVTEDKTTKVMSLPMFPEITLEQQKQVVDTLKRALDSVKVK